MKKIEPRPKIYLTEDEVKQARQRWNAYDSKKKKIIIAPGGGFQKNAGEMRTSII